MTSDISGKRAACIIIGFTVMVAIVVGFIIYYGGGWQYDYGSFDNAPEAASEPVSAQVIPDVSACSEIDFSRYSRGAVEPNELVQATKTRTVIYVNGDVGRDAHITLTGESSCLYINGSIASGGSILLEGNESGVIVNGAIALSASIETSGRESVVSLPSFVGGPIWPRISVNIAGGGKLFIKSGEAKGS